MINIWMLTREYGDFAGAGGVKDVTRQLAEAVARSGRRVSVVLPLYGFMDPRELGFSMLDLSFEVDMPYLDQERREFVRVFQRVFPVGKGAVSIKGSLTVYLLDAQRYCEKKSVYTYSAAEELENPFHRQGTGHYDYFAMNVLLQKAALALMICLDERPDVIHCHDGHTAIVPAIIRETEGYRHYFRHTGVVVTIHNAGYGYHQDVDDLPFAQVITGLPAKVVEDNLLDGSFDPLLAASSYAVVNTVSENYARELQETEDDHLTGWLGHRFLARGVRLHGVTNGISPADFDPGSPKKMGIAAAFDPLKGDLRGKAICREHLQARLMENASGLTSIPRVVQAGMLAEADGMPLFTFVGRLTTQKGIDKLLGALDSLLPLDRDFQVLFLGTGPKDVEDSIVALAERAEHRGRVCILRGYDPVLANQVFAAGDFFLIPSQFEPCGLTDFMAQLFGNLPVVHHVGGLVKVSDGETGFSYREHSSAALMGTMQRAMQVFRHDPARLRTMQQTSVQLIRERYTWDQVLNRYLDLYEEARSKTS